MKISYGKIVGDKFIKEVNWNRAVLWMSKKISLSVKDMNKIRDNDIRYVEFHDRTKNLIHRALKKHVLESSQLNKYFQEAQYYMPIEIFKEVGDNE